MLRILKYASLFVWLPIAGFTYEAYAASERPHVIWEYKFYDNGDRYNPRAERDYITCTYIGPHGEFTVPAHFGKCPWVRMFDPQGNVSPIRQ